ncbi:orotate phosphoribosyltransferase [Alkalicella caledoniensis]|nr:orotate phosphoribosyltransferase [Alkalicella caledoniensis]
MENRIKEILTESGVLQSGHFVLTSGKHSEEYMQCAKVFQYPHFTKELSEMIAAKFKNSEVDMVIGPAVGGIILSYQVAESLGVMNVFAEREQGKMTLRRGFGIKEGQRILVVEDVVTTGGSVKEVINLVKSRGAIVVGVACLVDRSSNNKVFEEELYGLYHVNITTYESDSCPLCVKGLPITKPGSRNLVEKESYYERNRKF